MIKTFKISNTNFTFGFKHRNKEKYSSNSNDFRFGIFYKQSKIVGKKNFNIPKEWNNNLINDYTIGIDLIVFQTWISFNYNGIINNL